MTIWKRERNHFNYYVTNERKQPHIYVEALGTPSASTEKVLKDHCKKFFLFLLFEYKKGLLLVLYHK